MNELKRKDLEEVLELLINENTTHLGLKIAEERFDCKLLSYSEYIAQDYTNLRRCYFMNFENKNIDFVLAEKEDFKLDQYIYKMSGYTLYRPYGEYHFLIYLPC